MFRHVKGCKAQFQDMTLMAAHEFVEWHVVIIKNPATLIQGDRQFSEEKARSHARQLAERYISEEAKGDAVNLPADFAWVPLEPGDWVAFHP